MPLPYHAPPARMSVCPRRRTRPHARLAAACSMLLLRADCCCGLVRAAAAVARPAAPAHAARAGGETPARRRKNLQHFHFSIFNILYF